MLQLKRSVLLCLFTFLALIGCKQSKEVTKDSMAIEKKSLVNFYTSDNLSNVIDLAKEHSKPIYVDIYTDWCLPCQVMTDEVYSDQATAEFLNDNFISYKVNAEKANGPDLTYLFGVKQIPVLMFLDHRGRVLDRKDGIMMHSELKEKGMFALESFQKQTSDSE